VLQKTSHLGRGWNRHRRRRFAPTRQLRVRRYVVCDHSILHCCADDTSNVDEARVNRAGFQRLILHRLDPCLDVRWFQAVEGNVADRCRIDGECHRFPSPCDPHLMLRPFCVEALQRGLAELRVDIRSRRLSSGLLLQPLASIFLAREQLDPGLPSSLIISAFQRSPRPYRAAGTRLCDPSSFRTRIVQRSWVRVRPGVRLLMGGMVDPVTDSGKARNCQVIVAKKFPVNT
jgi:hypothetical protein